MTNTTDPDAAPTVVDLLGGGLRYARVMVGTDTFHPLRQRIQNLLSHGRRITLSTRFPDVLLSEPKTKVGLSVTEIENHPHSFTVYLGHGTLDGFGLAIPATGGETAQQVWERWYAEDRTTMTMVSIRGGLPGDGPATDDQIVITRWFSNGVAREWLIGFDSHTGSARLRRAYTDLVELNETLSDQQPWDIKAKLAELAEILAAEINQSAGEQ
jgi:hypothetical protein